MELTFRHFCEERQRMCSEYPTFGDACENCPLYELTHCIDCERTCITYPDKAENIVYDWSISHPKLSNLGKLVEVIEETFPTLKMGVNGNTIYLINSLGPVDLKKWAGEEYEDGYE